MGKWIFASVCAVTALTGLAMQGCGGSAFVSSTDGGGLSDGSGGSTSGGGSSGATSSSSASSSSSGSTSSSGSGSGSTSSSGSSGSSGSSSSGSTSSTSSTSSGSGGSSTSSGSSGAGDAGPPCGALLDKVVSARTAAEQCCPACNIVQCTSTVADLCCPTTVANAGSQATANLVNAISAYRDAGCTMVCPAIACHVGASGVCDTTTSLCQ